jgi:hypothetical protein
MVCLVPSAAALLLSAAATAYAANACPPIPASGNPYNVSCTALPNGDLLFYGRHAMQPMNGYPSMRHAIFIIPVVAVTTSTDPKVPTVPVFQITFVPQGADASALVTLGMTVTPSTNNGLQSIQIGIDAKTPDGLATQAVYDCSLLVIATTPPPMAKH